MGSLSKKPIDEKLGKGAHNLQTFEYALQKMEEQLRDEIALWSLLLEQSRDGLVVLDQDGKVYMANKQFADMLGYSMEEIYQLYVWDWDFQYKKEQLQEMLRGVDSSGDHFETLHRRKDGTIINVELSNNGSVYKGQKLVFCICRDVTERNRMEDRLRESETRYQELCIIDDLTRLYNSRHFYDQLKMEIDRADRYVQSLTLLLLDLDNFKHFNDTYGHIEGDLVLTRFAQVIRRCLRKTDIAFRYGGEEFVVLMPVTTCAEGIVTANRIQAELKKENFSPFTDEKVYVTVSIGVAEYQQEEDMKAFVSRVDKLMYEAKKNGRDRVCNLLSPSGC